MAQPPVPPIADDAKVALLLKEYDALRSEMVTRINNRFAIVGFVVALVAFLASRSDIPIVGRSLLAGGAAVLIFAVWWRFGQLMKRCSLRLAQIERQVNNVMGEDILIWESQIANKGLFHKIYCGSPPESSLRG